MSAAGAGGSLKSTELLEIAALQQQVLPYHVGAVASSVRHAPIRGLEKEYALLGANPDVRTLVFWVSAIHTPYIFQEDPKLITITNATAGHR